MERALNFVGEERSWKIICRLKRDPNDDSNKNERTSKIGRNGKRCQDKHDKWLWVLVGVWIKARTSKIFEEWLYGTTLMKGKADYTTFKQTY
jgi:hypothetical protein